jgi:glycosyltransferase involved in cell wall biosynthesis
MKNSYIFRVFSKKIYKRNTIKKYKNNINKKDVVLILNSNPWFSAVTDYSLQLSLFLKKNNKNILYGAELGSTAMDKKCEQYSIPFVNIPIHNMGVFNFFISFIKILSILFSNKFNIKNIFVFEGREHTLLVITKVIFPFLWQNKKLIRVRAQAQFLKNKFFSALVYKYYTDRIIFAADCVLNRVQFPIPNEKVMTQLYCKDYIKEIKLLECYNISKIFPILNFSDLTFMLVGRFDPVKGHELVINSFLQANFLKKTQLVLVGKSENIKASELFDKFKTKFEISIFDKNKYYLESSNKKVYIIDERFNDLDLLMMNSHFGVISSLDSEVVCRVGVEFLQLGIPCLYSNVGALPEVFIDFPELKFNKGDQDQLIAKFKTAENIYNLQSDYQSLKNQALSIGKNKYFIDNFKNILDQL